MSKPQHVPVMLDQVLKLLNPKVGESYLDLTAGYGGHAAAIVAKLGDQPQVTLVDRDGDAINHLTKRFKNAEIMQADFKSASRRLVADQKHYDLVLLDLGVSSAQIENPERGFSFQTSGPLDMRMDQRKSLSAADVVNHTHQTELTDLIYRFGQEHRSRQIAAAIVRARPITDTTQLAEIIRRALPRGRSRLHPATKTFQAIRMTVNDEFGQLEATLPNLMSLLAPGGRLAIISFHSLEDGLVKRWLKAQPDLQILTKKPLSGKQFDISNRRARSAQLRAAIKQPNSLS